MENKFEEIFEYLNKWKEFPKYQLERRIDIFIAMCLPQILQTKEISIELDDIMPEFPLKKEDNRSTNVDYVVKYKEDLYLIELKTNNSSINDKKPKDGGPRSID